MNKKGNERGFSLAWVIGIVVVTSIVSALTAGVADGSSGSDQDVQRYGSELHRRSVQ